MRNVVISGSPGSGKSTLAMALRKQIRWSLLAKDDYKERLFDSMGTGDRAWPRRLSDLAWQAYLI
jgi:predicted kinase